MPATDALLTADVDELTQRLLRLPTGGGRRLVAIAGPPASGKSVLSGALSTALAARGLKTSVIPMDGFHLDNAILSRRNLLARKGAPETFDAPGFIALMQRAKQGGEIYCPLFDRSRDLAVAGASVIDADCDLALVEGNYLLFDEGLWSALADLWDFSIWLDTPPATVRARCIQRWLGHGHSRADAVARAEQNDLRNARRIFAARLPADFVLEDRSDG